MALKRALCRWGRFLLNLLYPPNCIRCGGYSQGEPLCPGCQRELEHLRSTGMQELINRWRRPELDFLIAPFIYATGIKGVLIQMKNESDSRRLAYFSEQVANAFRDSGLSADVVVCMPMSRIKLRRRGFNHAELLAQAVAARLELPYLPGVLTMDDAAAVQHTLGRAERQKNAEKHIGFGSGAIQGKTVLVLDDICTTGSSLSVACRLLKEHGAVCTIAATIAITLR